MGSITEGMSEKMARAVKDTLTAEFKAFPSGALRNSEEDRLDYEGFLSPVVLKRFAEYMHSHRKMPDGTLRASDNWQLGMDEDRYMRSLWRHFMDVWSYRRGLGNLATEPYEEALCAVLFNTQGLLFEHLTKGNDDDNE